jgi:cbb3-type cytochrome oxidase subunit 3
MNIFSQLGWWDAHGITPWVLTCFTCLYASSDTIVIPFEGPEETRGTRLAVQSQYEYLCSVGGWGAHGITPWVLACFVGFYASSDTIMIPFEGPEETRGVRFAIHSQYEHLCSVGVMRCTWHNSVSSNLFCMFLCFVWHYYDTIQRSRRDERCASRRSFAIWISFLSWGMRCTWHNSVSSSLFCKFLCFIWHYYDIVRRSRRDERRALRCSFAIPTSLLSWGDEVHME